MTTHPGHGAGVLPPLKAVSVRHVVGIAAFAAAVGAAGLVFLGLLPPFAGLTGAGLGLTALAASRVDVAAGPRAVPADARTGLVLALVVVGAAVLVLLPQLTLWLLALPGPPDLAFGGLLIVALTVLALPLALPERAAAADATTRLTRVNATLAVTGLVGYTFLYTSGQTFLALAASALGLPLVLGVHRLLLARRGEVETGLRRRPLDRSLRPYLFQTVNHTVFWALIAATVLVGTYDLFRAVLGPRGYPLFLGALLAGCAAMVALTLVPGRTVLWGTNLLVAVGSIFLAVQLLLVVRPVADAVTMAAPFEGRWYVAQGGHAELVNYHHIAVGQHDAMDILVVLDGSTHAGDGAQLTDYYAFGAPLLAPGAGTVVTAVDTLPDMPVGQVDVDHPVGNHVVVDLGAGRFVLLAHLQRGSLRVQVGDRVAAGQLLAQVGNSGNTDEPHVHIQVQNRPDLDATDPDPGLVTWPILFRDVVVTRGGGQSVQPRADVRRGDYLVREDNGTGLTARTGTPSPAP